MSEEKTEGIVPEPVYKLHPRLEEVISMAAMEALAMPNRAQSQAQLADSVRCSRLLVEFVEAQGFTWQQFCSAANNVYLQMAFKEISQTKITMQMNMMIQSGQWLGLAINTEQKRKPWLLADQPEVGKILIAKQ